MQLPENWRMAPPQPSEVNDGWCVVICDASFKTGIAGISTLIRLNGKEYGPYETAARARGPVHSELTALKMALRRVSKLSIPTTIRGLVMYTDCKYACNFLEQLWVPRRGYMREIMADIGEAIRRIDDGHLTCYVCHTRTRYIKRCDRRARTRLDNELKNREDRVISRIKKVDAAIARGRSIRIIEFNGAFHALPRADGYLPGYRVSLYPPHCDCPWWVHNWGNKGEVVINARALPCKHMCALADYLGENVYELFAHQIERLD